MNILIVFLGVAIAAVFGNDEATTHHPSIGGNADVNVDDKTVNELMSTYLVRLVSGDGTSLGLVTIKKILKQVVAGMKYEVTGTFQRGVNKTSECVLTIWHRSWLDDVNEKVKLKADCAGEIIRAKNDDGNW